VGVAEAVAAEVLQQGMRDVVGPMGVPEDMATVLPEATVVDLGGHLTDIPGQLPRTDHTEAVMATLVAVLEPARGGEDEF
jgi:hypothetical protein